MMETVFQEMVAAIDVKLSMDMNVFSQILHVERLFLHHSR